MLQIYGTENLTKDLLFPPSDISGALEITRCLFVNLDLALGIEEVLTRDILEENLSWWKGEVFLVVKDPSSVYQVAGQDLALSY